MTEETRGNAMTYLLVLGRVYKSLVSLDFFGVFAVYGVEVFVWLFAVK